MSEWIAVTSVRGFEPGSRETFDLDGVQGLLLNVDGEYFAIEDKCSHAEVELNGGAVEGETIACPLHGAKFCLKSGKALTPPAYEDIETFKTRVVDGVIEVKEAD